MITARLSRSVTRGLSLSLLVQAALLTTAMAAPTAHVFLSAEVIHGGDPLTIGYAVSNPPDGSQADFYLGVVLPDGSVVVFPPKSTGDARGVRRSPARAADEAPPKPVRNVANLSPTFTVGPGVVRSDPVFAQFDVPRGGAQPGEYQFFAVLLTPGALSDGQLAPGEILAADRRIARAPQRDSDLVEDRFRRLLDLCEDKLVQALDEVAYRFSETITDAILERFRDNLPISFATDVLSVPTSAIRSFRSKPFGWPPFEKEVQGPPKICDDFAFDIVGIGVVIDEVVRRDIRVAPLEIARLADSAIVGDRPFPDGSLQLDVTIEGRNSGLARVAGSVELNRVALHPTVRIPGAARRIPLRRPVKFGSFQVGFVVDTTVVVGGVYAGLMTVLARVPIQLPGCYTEWALRSVVEVDLGQKVFTMFRNGTCDLSATHHGPGCESPTFGGSCAPGYGSFGIGTVGPLAIPLNVSGNGFSGAIDGYVSVEGSIVAGQAVGSFAGDFPEVVCTLAGHCPFNGSFALAPVFSVDRGPLLTSP
jgi:hypothetical protein